jgi:mono/diheme cytochrome c family protein
MSPKHPEQTTTEAGHLPDEKTEEFGVDQLSVEEPSEQDQEVPEPGKAEIPVWLVGVIGIGIFWAGAYLFSFSGGFRSDVFDFEPKFGVQGGGARGAPDPKVVGKSLFSSNCITCHQANGQGIPGQYPPLAGSEVELGDATNHLIAIVLKGLQGPVVVEGKPFNNSMQAWEGQYTDQQLAAILTYVRSDWGNNAPAITADMVKQIRDEFKDRKEQWTWPEVEKIPPKNLVAGPAAKPPGQAGAPAAGGQPPAPGQTPAPSATQSQPPAPSRPAQPQPGTQSQPPPPAPNPAH